MNASKRTLKSKIKDLPVSQKILAITLLSSLATLLLLCSISFYRESKSFSDRKVNELSALSRILESNSIASLVFDDPNTAKKYVDSLQHEPDIESVSIYTKDDQIFVYFARSETFTPHPAPTEFGDRWSGNRLFFAKEIFLDNELRGKILIEMDTRSLRAAVSQSFWISVALLIGGLTITLILTSRLQKLLTKPVEELAEVTRNISEEKGYNARAIKRCDDEIGSLVDSFNAMLDTIQLRDAELRKANIGLEQLVEARTEDLYSRNQELKKAIEAANAATVAKSEFLATTSHELRTPLNPIIGYAEKLLLAEKDSEKAKELHIIKHSATLLLRLIDDILEYSRIERGDVQLVSNKIPFQEFCQDLIYLMKGDAEAKGLTLTYDHEGKIGLPNEILFIEIDEGRLRQILLNLIGNAIKFTHSGSIKVSSRFEILDEGHGRLCIVIQDTGIGIEPKDMDKLFKSFSQVDGSLSRRYSGMGLGLAICRKLVEAMDGSIDCKSSPGRGSSFRFKIPVELEPNSVDQTSLSFPLSLENELPILLVEDEPVNRELGASMVKSMGYDVFCAKDGFSALELAKENHFGVVLLDIGMPGMDGFAAAKALRKQEGHDQHTPIIAVTANASPEYRQRCLEAGMDDFLPKPLIVAKLARVVAKWQRKSDQSSIQNQAGPPSSAL